MLSGHTWEKMSSKNLIDLRKRDQKPPAASVVQDLRMRPDRPVSRVPAKRVSPVRVRRERRRFIIVGIVLSVIAGVVYGIGWLSYLPRYTVGTVDVLGTTHVPSKLVYDFVETELYNGAYGFLSRDNIFLYNAHAIERGIVGFFPRIASATVSRSSLLATAITVSIVEREPFALWCSSSTHADCYEMDSTGFIFAQAPAGSTVTITSASTTSNATSTEFAPVSTVSTTHEYIFEGGLGTSTSATSSAFASKNNPIGRRFVGAHMPGLVALLQMLSRAGYTPSGAIVQNSQDFWIPLSEGMPAGSHGFYIKASFGEEPGSIVNDLQLVLSVDALAGKMDQLEYIDLRFGDRVYYKLRGTAETQSSQH